MKSVGVVRKRLVLMKIAAWLAQGTSACFPLHYDNSCNGEGHWKLTGFGVKLSIVLPD